MYGKNIDFNLLNVIQNIQNTFSTIVAVKLNVKLYSFDVFILFYTLMVFENQLVRY